MNVISTRLKVVTLLSVGAICLLSYQNCALKTDLDDLDGAAGDPQVSKIDMYAIPPGVSCDAPTSYTCTAKTFSPEAVDGVSTYTDCVSVGGEELCLEVAHFSYNTVSAYRRCPDCGPEAVEMGGRYNYQEFFCYQNQLKSAEGFVAEGEGGSLQEALSRAHQACMAVVGG